MTRDETVRNDLLAELPRLRGYAMNLTRNVTAGEDLLQQTSLRVIENAERFVPGSNFRAWTHTIMRRLWIGNWRKSRQRGTVDLRGLTDDALARDGDQEDVLYAKEVNAAIDNLASHQVDLMHLLSERYTYDEMAAMTGVPPDTVKSRIWRGREALRKAVA